MRGEDGGNLKLPAIVVPSNKLRGTLVFDLLGNIHDYLLLHFSFTFSKPVYDILIFHHTSFEALKDLSIR